MKTLRILIATFSLIATGSQLSGQPYSSCTPVQGTEQAYYPANSCAPCPPPMPCAPQSGQSCCIAACQIAAGAVIVSVFALIGGLFSEDSHSHAH